MRAIGLLRILFKVLIGIRMLGQTPAGSGWLSEGLKIAQIIWLCFAIPIN